MEKLALEKLYNNLRLVCYQLPCFLSDFENDCFIKNDIDKQTSNKIKQSIKKSISTIYDSTELVYNLLNSEEESDFQIIPGADDGRLD